MTNPPSCVADGPIVRFGRAELDPRAQELRIDGKRAPVGPRAIALLRLLVENSPRTVSKNELLDKVWRGTIVEENNLQVHISTLRRVLGAQAIATVPGRGYCFMLTIEGALQARPRATGPISLSDPGEQRAPAPANTSNLPQPQSELYGREDDCAAVCSLVGLHALVSVVGAAGMGKTRLALAAAAALTGSCPEGVWFVELAALNDPRLLVQTIAQSLRLTLPGLREPAEELAIALRKRQALLVIDNCEHIIDEVGGLVALLLRDAGGLRILATSQEPLKLSNEHIYRLAPLSVPEDREVHDPASYGAVRLFVERARALQPRFVLTNGNVDAAVEICRHLDGLPLAIELAAARVPVLGVAGVRERLGERFRMLTGGSRVAPPRHQTLRAALDWSHALLDADECAVFRRLGVFVGSFSLESAQELAASAGIDAWSVLEHMSSLIDKSLVLAEGEPRPRYRLLESTREYALEQLAQAGERPAWIERHAAATQHALERAIRERRSDLVLAEMGNVRSAYEWTRTAVSGAAEVAVALATLPAMVIAVDGAVQEARRRLLEVERLVSDDLPPLLVAQYWQWFGRIGLDGRLPTSRCIEAFERAERGFVQLERWRHVHACRRHLAEALLDAGDRDAAAAALERARALEVGDWPLADRMRRLRVEGLWYAKGGHIDDALATSLRALEMAQRGEIDRYELVLLEDIARVHLDSGHAHEAAERYLALAERARNANHGGLTFSNALSGLIAALVAEGDLDAADKVAREAVPVLGRSGIFAARADILACLLARQQRYPLAARLLGASAKFRAGCETPRDPIEQRCRNEALTLLEEAVAAEVREAWMAAGAAASEDVLAEAVVARGS